MENVIKLIPENPRKAYSFSMAITLICPNDGETYFKDPLLGKNMLRLSAVMPCVFTLLLTLASSKSLRLGTQRYFLLSLV